MKRVLVALACGAAFVATGCSADGEEGEAQPAPDTQVGSPTESAPREELPHSGAPAVDQPLPESVLSGHPCDLLERAQVEDALGEGASQGTVADEEGLGPRCDWGSARQDAGFVVSFYTDAAQGLSSWYANTRPKMKIFEEVEPIDGLPTVAFKKSHDDPICTLVTGISDKYAVGTTVTISTEKEDEGVDACQVGRQLATEVIGKLKAKA
ncbi:DUF3558 domain-containing protein [Prauserella rugosa]|uniref:Uncharacterized protein DUF3558 n=1 Tax=Prauserella rugosa TaxID=43354 RepID=A0A660CMR6_9PSEU|nr:DUF3558 domain-containing protein [Prauserella rugosa]KMS81362.1 hypothetical protein ACZ91_60855 [Streptomyces regensis]TWH22551.1 uncharacterized protein DUF3558 [Prauserella rugosa]